MRVLVACEYSGVVRDAFLAKGHDAISCDLLPTERPGPHYLGDVRNIIDNGWDLCLAFPPCTDLAVSGARWFKVKGQERQDAALDFVRLFLNAPIPRVAVENPVGVISTRIRPPNFTVQPYEFGHGETKRTCFWTRNLPDLRPTNIVEGREQRVHLMPPGPDRWKERSRTFQGIADAMADQWGVLTPVQETLI